MADNILEVRNLKKYFTTHKGNVHAVDNVSFTLERGKHWESWASPAAENPPQAERFYG